MNPIFADSAHWIAMVSPDDGLHAAAAKQMLAVGSRPIITSQMVLVEFLDGAAVRGAYNRNRAAAYAERIPLLPNVRVISQTPELFDAALALYKQRLDKAWSLTDCASFVICEREGITDVLTHDHHFTQMGLNTLLRLPAS